jgi:inorganic triphosphatase YgiF
MTGQESTERVRPGPREVEAALLVWSERAEELLKQIAGLSELSLYPLREGSMERIRDIYFDTPKGELGRQRIALRARMINGEQLLTLKADTHRKGASADRLEIEAGWSWPTLSAAWEELRGRGLLLPAPSPPLLDRELSEPRVELAQLRLYPVQERETRRETRSVIDPTDGADLAELDLDSVEYVFTDGRARLYEVEIEARKAGADLDVIVDALLGAFSELVPWPYSKLATGKAIERGLTEGILRPDSEGRLPLAGYVWLKRELETAG